MGSMGAEADRLITGIAHVNLIVPAGSLADAHEFYGTTLGLTSIPVPKAMEGKLAWFDITPGGQQIHIAIGPAETVESSRHPCFKIPSPDALLQLQQRIYQHYRSQPVGKPRSADKPGEENSGSKGVEFPSRFFARDYAGNRLEFSL